MHTKRILKPNICEVLIKLARKKRINIGRPHLANMVLGQARPYHNIGIKGLINSGIVIPIKHHRENKYIVLSKYGKSFIEKCFGKKNIPYIHRKKKILITSIIIFFLLFNLCSGLANLIMAKIFPDTLIFKIIIDVLFIFSILFITFGMFNSNLADKKRFALSKTTTEAEFKNMIKKVSNLSWNEDLDNLFMNYKK